MTDTEQWPALPWDAWKDTCDTLHMWTQIVGKVKLECAPFLNQYWQSGFHVTSRGLTTGLFPAAGRAFEVRFDFIDHNLSVSGSDGQLKFMPLMPRSVADFYEEFMAVLRTLGLDVSINPHPVETAISVPFNEDREHNAYDGTYVRTWWWVLTRVATVLERYRSTFTGKSSPILFYWGAFDLGEARYSGKAVTPPDGPRFYQLTENEENIACGFWPGNAGPAGPAFGEPAFYSYTNPAPSGLAQAAIQPAQATFDSRLGEFILRYEDARRAPSPDDAVLEFFQSTYEAGSDLAHWDRQALERVPGDIETGRG